MSCAPRRPKEHIYAQEGTVLQCTWFWPSVRRYSPKSYTNHIRIQHHPTLSCLRHRNRESIDVPWRQLWHWRQPLPGGHEDRQRPCGISSPPRDIALLLLHKWLWSTEEFGGLPRPNWLMPSSELTAFLSWGASGISISMICTGFSVSRLTVEADISVSKLHREYNDKNR